MFKSSNCAFLLVVLCVCSCAEPENPSAIRSVSDTPARSTGEWDSTAQISQYIRCIFQDRDGNFWFGTTTDGVVRYDGSTLDYFNAANQFGSDWVNAITQDARGDLWYGTRNGLVRYDGTRFTRYTTKDGLVDDHLWCLLLDRSGILWCGTWEGVSRFDGTTFTKFPIPAADLSGHPYYQDPKKINAIVEDKAGNIWFAANGGGAYRYDGKSLTNLSEKDGLCSNFVGSMLVDRKGGLWFGTRFGGLCTFDGTAFTKGDPEGGDLGVLYQQLNGTLWTVNTLTGLCSYDASVALSAGGTSFTCFTEQDGRGIRVPMSLLEDTRGRLWIGTGAGLYRFDAGTFTNWTKEDVLGMNE